MYEDVYKTAHVQDKVGQKDMVNSLNRLDKALSRQYLILSIICVAQKIISAITYLIGSSRLSKSQKRACFGWSDTFYIIAPFLFVEIFTKNALITIINVIWDKCTKSCKRNNDDCMTSNYCARENNDNPILNNLDHG